MLQRIISFIFLKDLSLDRIIQLLESDDPAITSNAAAYLQHLTYNNSENKRAICNAGGIEALVAALEDRRSSDQTIEHAAGALRNASYGCNENKVGKLLIISCNHFYDLASNKEMRRYLGSSQNT